MRKLTISISDEELAAATEYASVKETLAQRLAEAIVSRLHLTLEVTMDRDVSVDD